MFQKAIVSVVCNIREVRRHPTVKNVKLCVIDVQDKDLVNGV